MSKKKILITGGAGYIGSHTIVELLTTNDFEVVSIDNFCNSYPFIYKEIEKITGKSFKNYKIDICDYNALEKVFEMEQNIDAIIHFAALKSVPESVEMPLKYYRNNLNSLSNLLELSAKYKIKRFVFSSSCSVYGDIQTSPVSETTPFKNPESPYAHTKQIGEKMIEDFSKNVEMQFVNLRYFNPAGAHKSALIGEIPVLKATSLIPVITETAIGFREEITIHGTDLNTRDGSCIRDYVHVMDIARAHLKAVNVQLPTDIKIEVFNLGTGEGVSVIEAINTFEKTCGIELNKVYGPKREGDVEMIFSDCTKSKEKLNWQAELSLEEMLRSAWEWEKHKNTIILEQK